MIQLNKIIPGETHYGAHYSTNEEDRGYSNKTEI